MPLIIFTHHAVEQFITRYNRTLTAAAAEEILKIHASNAIKSSEKTRSGEYYWDVPKLSMRLVTKLDKAQHICVTVVSMQDNFRDLQEAMLHEATLLESVQVNEPVYVEESPVVTFKKHSFQVVVDIACDIPSDIEADQAKNRIKKGIEEWVRVNALKHVLVTDHTVTLKEAS